MACSKASRAGSRMVKPGSLAGFGLELDRALELRNLSRHDVHAHAPSRDGVGTRPGGEAGLEDQAVQPIDAGMLAGARSPRLRAFAAIASWFKPRPSSWTAMISVLPSRRASSVIRPAGGLPAASTLRRRARSRAPRRCEPRARAARTPCPGRPGRGRFPRRP